MNNNYLEPISINEEKAKKVMGSRILQKRKANGLTQSEFAEIIGISTQQLSNIENGYSFPRMASFIKICSYFKTNADYFIGGKINDKLDENIVELIEELTIEEQKNHWILLNAYIHRNDNDQI